MQYQIQGETLPVVICQLSAGERMITEGGGMAWMSPNMKMETTSNGGLGRALGRMFSGEKMFQNIYTAQGGPGMIAFASSHLAAMTASCQIDIQTVPGVKNILFGGEGLFNTVITGPGHVWLQTMPISNVAECLRPYFPSGGNN